MRRAFADLLQGFEAVPRLFYPIAFEFEDHPQALTDGRLVVDDENRGFGRLHTCFECNKRKQGRLDVEPARAVDALRSCAAARPIRVQGTRTMAK